MTEGHEKHLANVDHVIRAVDNLAAAVTHADTAWAWKKLRIYAGALFERAPFKRGDRVRLTKTPEINTATSWGWMSAKHFLVAGAVGTVAYVDFSDDQFCGFVKWDDESFIGDDKQAHPIPEDERHLFCMREPFLERISSLTGSSNT